MRAVLACFFLCLVAACSSKQAARAPVDPYAALMADLRQGGYVLYLRHAETATASEEVVRNLADCSWQRNLNEFGRQQAVKIGERFREHGIAFTRVEASPFCRARETAALVFGRQPLINNDLYYHVSQTLPEIDATNAKLKARLGLRPVGNVALIGHAPTMREAAKIELPEGTGALVKPNGDGTFRVVARVSINGISPQ
jgi:phosphohistidine phosphatase SixA